MCISGLPWWLNSEESACNVGASGDVGSIPGSGRSPGEGNGDPLQYSSLKNHVDIEAWRTTVHGVANSWTRLRAGLKLNIQKTNIMSSSPITSWQIDGETMEMVTDFIFLDSEIIAGMKLKDDCSLEEKL